MNATDWADASPLSLYLRGLSTCLWQGSASSRMGRPHMGVKLYKGKQTVEGCQGPVRWTVDRDELPLGVAARSLPLCSSLPALLASVKHGRREWTEPLSKWGGIEHDCEKPGDAIATELSPELRREHTPSRFVPATCTVPWHSPRSTCNMLAGFDALHFVGDSLTRQLVQGLRMAATGDYARGGLRPLGGKNTLAAELRPWAETRCACDAQFHNQCRDPPLDISGLNDWLRDGICQASSRAAGSGGRRGALTMFGGGAGLFDACMLPEGWACWRGLAKPRRVFVLLQGGLHYKVNATRAIDKLLDKSLHCIGKAMEQCEAGRVAHVHVLFAGIDTQSRWKDASTGSGFGAFGARQRRERVHTFMNAVASHAHAVWGVPTLDFMNLSAEAYALDGLHHHSNVNLAKAHVLLGVLHLIANGNDTASLLTLASLRRGALRAKVAAARQRQIDRQTDKWIRTAHQRRYRLQAYDLRASSQRNLTSRTNFTTVHRPHVHPPS